MNFVKFLRIKFCPSRRGIFYILEKMSISCTLVHVDTRTFDICDSNYLARNISCRQMESAYSSHME